MAPRLAVMVGRGATLVGKSLTPRSSHVTRPMRIAPATDVGNAWTVR
jgi:hypothetical protein